MATYFVDPAKSVWAATTAYTTGQFVCPTQGYATAAAKKYVYECTSGGTSGGTEPTWVYTTPDTSTTTDSGVTWTCRNCDTWEKATKYASNLMEYSQGTAFAAGDNIYFKYDSAATAKAVGSNQSFVGSTSGDPTNLISSVAGSGTTVSYAEATEKQIVISGAYDLTFDGSFALYGVWPASGKNVVLGADGNEVMLMRDGKVTPAGNYSFTITGSGQNKCRVENVTVDLESDTGGSGTSVINIGSIAGELRNIDFAGTQTNRTGAVIQAGGTQADIFVSGVDMSGFSNANAEVFACDTSGNISIRVSNCKTKTSPVLFTTQYPQTSGGRFEISNVGPSDAPEQMMLRVYAGQVESETTIVRTGGASIEGTPVSWKMTTQGNACEAAPLYTPWIYGVLSSTGSKTFSIAAARDGSATPYTDAVLWMEVEVLGTANSPLLTMWDDWRGGTGAAPANILSAANNQTADGSSAWPNIGATNNLMTLAVAGVTVGEEGLFRARVAFAGAAADVVYVDPKVTVS